MGSTRHHAVRRRVLEMHLQYQFYTTGPYYSDRGQDPNKGTSLTDITEHVGYSDMHGL